MALANLLFGTRKAFWACAEKTIRNFAFREAATSSVINTDNITQNLKSAINAPQVLQMVSINLPQFQSLHIMQALKTLFQLQKQGSTADIINNENFALLCKKLKKNCRSLEINESIEALKILIFLGVPSNSTIIQALLQLIKHSINTLSLPNIIFIDFILRKCENSTPLAEALLIALPLVFQLQLQTVIDHENIDELIEYLHYAVKNNLAQNCIQSIISALTIHGEELPIYAAKNVVLALSNIKHFEPSYYRLLENSMKVLKNNIMHLSFENMEFILDKLKEKYIQDYHYFYDEEYFDKCAEYIVANKCDITQIVWVMRKLIRLGHLHMGLLNYMEEQIVQQPQLLSEARPVVFFTIIAAFGFADYKPKHMDVISTAIMANELFITGKDELPWAKCAVEMAVIDCYNDNLLSRIFSPTFLKKYLARDFNRLDYLQLLCLHQAVKTLHKSYRGPFLNPDVINHAMEINKNIFDSPVKPALISALGSKKFVATGVVSKFGHVIDHVLVMRNGSPLPICPAIDQDIIYIEDIVVPENSTIICIMCLYKGSYTVNNQRMKGNSSLILRTLEALDYKVLPISMHIWKNLDDREKIPYLLQGINEKCEENSK